MKRTRTTRTEDYHLAAGQASGRRSRPLDPDGRRRVLRRSSRPRLWFLSWCAAGATALSAAIVAGSPLITGSWGWSWIGATAVLAALAANQVWRRSTEVPVKLTRIGVGVAAALVVLMGVGASTQLVIDGRPQLAVSPEARSHDLVSGLYQDLLTLAEADELIAYSQPDARARYNLYQPSVESLRSINNRWARVDLGSLPDPDLIEVVQHIKVAATFGAEALQLRYQLITEPDVRAEQSLAVNRSAFVAETLDAGAKLKPLAERYKVDTGSPGRSE
jgi:hypothetical protein